MLRRSLGLFQQRTNRPLNQRFSPSVYRIPFLSFSTQGKSKNPYFHPGDLLGVIRLDSFHYSPAKNVIGVTELACHLSGKGREYCRPDIVRSSVVDFYCKYLRIIQSVSLPLRMQFPEMGDFADSLHKRDMHGMTASNEKMDALIAEIEERFGKEVKVLTIDEFHRQKEEQASALKVK